MQIQNKPLEFRNVIKFWLLIIASVTPLLYFPVAGKLNSYFPKYIFLIIMLTIILFTIILFRKQIYPLIEFDSENKLLLIFYIFLLFSVFFALDRTTAIVGSDIRFEGLLTLTSYYLIFLCSRTIKNIDKKFILIMVFVGTLISTHGIMQVYGIDPVPSYFYPEVVLNMHSSFSSMGQPNHLGTYLVLLIPFAVYLYFDKNQPVGFFFYSVIFFALLCTNTRGAWIGFGISIFAFFILKFKNYGIEKIEKKKILYTLLASIFLLFIYTFTNDNSFGARFISIFSDFSKATSGANNSYRAGSGRIGIWTEVIELIKLRPIFGVGIDNLSIALKTFCEQDIMTKFGPIGFVNWSKAHNEYLQTAVTSGIPSLIVYISLVAIIIKKSVSRIQYSDFYLPLTASLVGFYIIGFFNNETINFAYLLWMFLGFACSKEIISYSAKKR